MRFFDDVSLMKRNTLSNDKSGATRLRFDSSGRPRLEALLYNDTGGTLTTDRPYLVRFDGDEEVNPRVIVPVVSNVSGSSVSGALTPDLLVVATTGIASGTWGWFTYRGYTNIMVEGTVAVAKDDHLRMTIATSAVALVKDTNFDLGVYNAAVACAAQGSAGAVTTFCYLIGKPLQIG